VIQAFNSDKPYDRSSARRSWGELGPARLSRRDRNRFNRHYAGVEYNAQNLRQRRQDTSTTSPTRSALCFSESDLRLAQRCHDHKFDPSCRRLLRLQCSVPT